MDARTSSQLLSLYGPPLSDGEVRVVTIQADTVHGLLSCALERVSLQAKTPTYEQFLHSYDSEDVPNRWLISTWASIQRRKVYSSSVPRGSMDEATPLDNSMRFTWGDFAALSYVWGDDYSKRIIINGVETTVTKNLEEALQEFRHRYGHFSGRYRLWVDALCLNQNDKNELADQIAKMREIYSQAWTVIAWLGPAANDSHEAFRLLANFAKLDHLGKERISQVLKVNPGHYGDTAFWALQELLLRDYWWRLWIIQELVLGSFSTIIRCGKDTLDWKTFSDGIATLYHGSIWATKDRLLERELKLKKLRTDPRWITPSIHLIHQNLRPLSEYEFRGGKRQSPRKLFELAESDCRDEKDKVFGLLGMMDGRIAGMLAMEYTKSTEEIFTATTKAFIGVYGLLEPLRESNPWGSVGVPSWVVDWTWDGRIRYSKPETAFTGPFWAPGAPEPRPEMIYSADGRTPAQYGFLAHDKLLKCKGFILDTISGLGACERGIFKYAPGTIARPRNWTSIYADFPRALYSLMLMGRVSNGEHVSERHSALLNLPRQYEQAYSQFDLRGWTWMRDQLAYYYRWVGWHQLHDGLQVGDRCLGDYFTDTIPDDAVQFDYAEVAAAADRTMMGRRLMFTTKGYMGWAPDNAEGLITNQTRVGDVVCIVFGCSTPIVIRPAGSHFQVLGEAYVEGVMNGEALKLVEAGELQVRDLIFT